MKPFEQVEHTADYAIVVRGGDLRELVENAGHGMISLLVEPEDIGSLHEVLKSLLTDRERLSNLRRSCLSTAQKRYSTDSTVEAFRQILRLG